MIIKAVKVLDYVELGIIGVFEDLLLKLLECHVLNANEDIYALLIHLIDEFN